MNYIRIKSRPLRRFLLKYYDADGDGRLSEKDLQGVTYLEITTPVMQLWDETPEISLVTRCFCHPKDLRKLPNLECLVISSQPIFRLCLTQSSLARVAVIRCPLRKIRIHGETLRPEKGDNQIDFINEDEQDVRKY